MAEPQVLDPLVGIVVNQALDAGVNPALYLSLVHQESRFDPNAKSPTLVTGLAQVTNRTGMRYGQTPETRTDPVVSARAGALYLKDLLDQNSGNVPAALRAYNGGTDPNYVQNVLSHYGQYAYLQGVVRHPGERQAASQAAPAANTSEASRLADQFLGQPVTPQSSGDESTALADRFLQQTGGESQVYPEGSVTATIAPEGAPETTMVVGQGQTLPSGTQLEGQTVENRPIQEGPKAGETGIVAPSVGEQLNQAGRFVANVAVPVASSMVGAGYGGAIGGAPGAILGGVAGALGGNVLSRVSGLSDEAPIAEPFGVRMYLSDLAALGSGALEGAARLVPAVPGFLARRTQASKAIDAAQDAYQAAVKEAQAAQAAAEAKYPGQVSKYTTAAEKAYKEELAGVKRVQGEVQNYEAAQEAARQFDTAVAAQAAADVRLQAVPSQFRAQMPPRDMTDIALDWQRLKQGPGRGAEEVMRHYGVNTIDEASLKLANEADALARAGQAMPPNPRPSLNGVSATHEAINAVDPNAVELQNAILKNGRINIANADAQSEWLDLGSRKQTGSHGPGGQAGLLSNRSNMTPDKMAQALHEQGYLDTPETGELMAKLRQSVEGNPVYPASAYGEAPIGTEQATGPFVSSGGVGGRVTRRLYQRFDDMYGGAPVDTSPVQETLAGMQQKLEQTSPGFQRLAEGIAKEGVSSTGHDVHEHMKLLNTYWKNGNSATRQSAMQLHGAYQEALEQSIPEAVGPTGPLTQAKAAYNMDQAANELERMVGQTGPGAMTRWDAATKRKIVNLDTVVNKLTSPAVMRHLTPEKQQQLLDIRDTFFGVPGMPKGERPVVPQFRPQGPELLPGSMGAPPGDFPLKDLGTYPVFQMPRPEDLPRPSVQISPWDLVHAVAGTGALFKGRPGYAGAILASDVARVGGPYFNHALSKMLLSDKGLPWLLGALRQSGGEVTPEIARVMRLYTGARIGGTSALAGRSERTETDSAGAPVTR